jgi:hypothetical protein
MTPIFSPTDTITFLQCKQPLVLTKTWHNGSIRDYDTAKHFRVYEKPVDGIERLAKLLKGAAGEPRYAAIRGAHTGETLEDVTRTMTNFTDRPRHWVMFDIDGFTPEVSPVESPEAGVREWIVKTLPEAFQSVACYWQLSASAGHSSRDPAGLRAHVWFWLDRPISGNQWKRWAEHNNIKVDKSVFSPVQLHYTANPVIELGSDPYIERSGLIKGPDLADLVETALCRFKDAPDEALIVNDRGDSVLRDPRTVPGVVGLFCTRVPVLEVVTTILDGSFELCTNENGQWDGRRLNFLQGSGGQGGAFIHSDGLHLVNMQTHAPGHTQAKALNAFDLVRVYLFGHLDPADPFLRLDITNLPSHTATVEWVEAYLANQGATDALPVDQDGPGQSGESEPLEAHEEPDTAFPGAFQGVMADVVNATLMASHVKQPRLAVMGALMGMAGSIGGHYKLASGMRLNLYGLNISPSGSGKDLVRRAAKAIVFAAQATPIGCPASGQGLQDAINETGPTFVETDEAGHLFASMSAKNAGAHSVELGKMLLELFSAGFGPYATRLKAKSANNAPSRVIQNPTVSFFGSTTTERLASALTEDNVTDGLIGRFLFAVGSTKKDQAFTWSAPEFEPPQSVLSAGLVLAYAAGGEKMIGRGPGVVPLMSTWAQGYWAVATGSKQRVLRAFATRSIEKIERVAGVLAVWENPENPVMSVEHITWAKQFVDYSNTEVCRFVEHDMVVDSPIIAGAKRLMDKLEGLVAKGKSKDGWVTRSAVMRAGRFDGAIMKAAVETLVGWGAIEEHSVRGAGTKPTQHLRALRDFEGDRRNT